MSDAPILLWRGGPRQDIEPVSFGEAVDAALDSLRLAWAADRRGLLVVGGLRAVTTSAQIVQVVAGRQVVGAVLEGERPRAQAGRVIVLGAATLLARAGQSAGTALQAPVGQAVARQAQSRILDVVAGLELADVEDPDFQDQLQRALMGADGQTRLVSAALSVPAAGLDFAIALVSMGSTDWVLIPLGLLSAVPQWLLTRKEQDPGSVWRRRGREMRASGWLQHVLTGTEAAHELRAFDASPFLRSRHDALVAEAARAQNEIMRRNSRRTTLTSLAGRVADAPAAARLLLRVARRDASLDQAVAGGVANRQVATTLDRITRLVSGLPRAAALVSDYRAFESQPRVRRGGPAPPGSFSSIAVEDVSFTYRGADRPVLEGVSFEIRRGEVVALVGENGCGKTTLAKVLCGLYAPTKGSIWWDDVDAVDCDPAEVRRHIAIVFQDFVRYRSLTAAENIGIGLPARLGDREAIERAARSAGAHEAIAALPKGYDTILSRAFDGTELSTGQWQRVALARAFLRDAPFVVLDEPTAALDPRAERDLFETVASLYRSRSALLISHRLSSVRFADRICVLAGGRITESGTHEELLEEGGAYAELFELQARAYR